MTDATFDAIVAHVRANAIPPMPPALPDGLGLELVKDRDVPDDQPDLRRGRIRLSPADYRNLTGRLERLAGTDGLAAATETIAAAADPADRLDPPT